MNFDNTITKKIANLAFIEISEEECKNFTNELKAVLKWIDSLKETNTDSVEPYSPGDSKAPWRVDKAFDADRAKVTANADTRHGFFIANNAID